MVAGTDGPSVAVHSLGWNLLFARQPEPDLEFTDVWRDETATVGSPPPLKPPKQPRRRLLLWTVFFALIGGVYVAVGPEPVAEYFGSLLDEPPAPQPSVARKPVPPTAIPSKQPEQDWSFLAPAESPTSSSPTGAPPATAGAPAQSTPTVTSAKQAEQDWSFLAPEDTALPATASAPATTAAPSKQSERDRAFLARMEAITRERHSMPGTRGSPAPLFHEGQRVSVRPDLNAPSWTVLLRLDADGAMPGPTILPGTVLTILDGELHGRDWIYLVRSDIGFEGWLTEGQLRSTR